MSSNLALLAQFGQLSLDLFGLGFVCTHDLAYFEIVCNGIDLRVIEFEIVLFEIGFHFQ